MREYCLFLFFDRNSLILLIYNILKNENQERGIEKMSKVKIREK